MTSAEQTEQFGPSSRVSARAGSVSADATCTMVLVAVWLVIMVAVDPLGDFPIGDDFGFAPAVWTLLDSGRLKLSDWGAMNLASQIAWGALFASLFGKTYTALRLSTLVLGGLGAVGLYRLLRTTLQPANALLGALLLALNPLYLTTAVTFMTDVPYTAMQTLSLWLLASGWQRQSRLRTAGGWAFAAAALLCRQIGIAIAVAAGIVRLTSGPLTFRRCAEAAAPIIGLLALQLGYHEVLRATGGLPQNYGLQINTAMTGLTRDFMGVATAVPIYIGVACIYLGFFLLPATLAWWKSAGEEDRKSKALIASAVLVISMYLVVYLAGYRSFPFIIGVWQNAYGFGMEFTGTTVPVWMSKIVSLLGLIGGVALVFTIISVFAKRGIENRPSTRLGIALAALLLAPLPIVTPWLDRYLIPVLPCAILALSPVLRDLKKPSLIVGLSMAALMGVISTATAHDYLSFKRVQWQAYTDLRKRAPADSIDADWTINAPRLLPQLINVPVTCWHVTESFKIWPGPWPGYTVDASYPVPRWLPWDRAASDVHVLRLVGQAPHGWDGSSCPSTTGPSAPPYGLRFPQHR